VEEAQGRRQQAQPGRHRAARRRPVRHQRGHHQRQRLRRHTTQARRCSGVLVEVDATSPFVQLRPIEVSTSTGGTIEIRWTATDKNLHAEPIHLYYRTRQDGPWQSIAHNVKNEGIYRWSIPRDVGNQFFFKIEAIDQAGNVGRAETTSAVVLDMSEPRGVILGVTSSARRRGARRGIRNVPTPLAA